MGLVAREIEARGIATVCILNLREVAERVRPPRTLLVSRPFGAVLGPPGEAELQKATIRAALDLITDTDGQAGAIREFA